MRDNRQYFLRLLAHSIFPFSSERGAVHRYPFERVLPHFFLPREGLPVKSEGGIRITKGSLVVGATSRLCSKVVFRGWTLVSGRL